jgi:3-dehydrosphinganine reductase
MVSGDTNARRSVIVTGGSSGIGLATAIAFAADGYDVAIIARNPERLERARAEIALACRDDAQRVTTGRADLSDFDMGRAALEALRDEGFAPDVIVNSAGVIVPGEFVSMTLEDIEANMSHGFWSVLYPCRVVAPWMIERHAGHIINVSSVAGFFGVYGYTAYAAAKYAVMGFTEALRSELKPHGVKVSVICPPDVETPGLEFERTLRPPETDVIAGNVKPISADVVAAAILKAVDTGRYMVIPDRRSRLYFRVKGIAPEIFHAVVDSDVAKTRSGAKGPKKGRTDAK